MAKLSNLTQLQETLHHDKGALQTAGAESAGKWHTVVLNLDPPPGYIN